MRKFLPCLALLALGATGANADVLLLEGLQKAADTAAQRPSRGMTMERVADGWGDPETRRGPVGDPPITRWEYPDFVVIFEYRHVVHAVPLR